MAPCIHCGKEIKHARNIARHLKSCNKYLAERAKLMCLVEAALGPASSSGPVESGAVGQPDHHPAREQRNMQQELTPLDLVARMVALGGIDASIVENEDFKILVQNHWPDSSQVPSPVVIDEICDGIFDKERKDVWKSWDEMKQPKARVSLAVGRAKTMDREVLYTACQFIDDQWKLHKVVLDAHVLVPYLSYHGPLLDVPEVRTGADQMDMDVGEAPLLGTSFGPAHLRSNLFMMAWGILQSSESESYQHDYEMAIRYIHSETMKDQLGEVFGDTFPLKMGLVSTTFVDHILEPVARCLRWLFMGFRKIMHEELLGLHLTRKVRQDLHSELKLRSISTDDKDWYRTYCALEILKEKKSALMDEDPELVKLLIDVFGTIYRAIQAVSAPSIPTSNLCLPQLFKVRTVLSLEVQRSDGGNNVYNLSADAIPKPENIAKCLKDALEAVDKAVQDSYLLWSVPLVLDPRYKLQKTYSLFENAYGSEKAGVMSSKVSSKLKELYTKYSQDDGNIGMSIDSTGPSEQAKTCLDKYLLEDHHPICSKKGKEKMDTANVPPEEDLDILDWWVKNEGTYPLVARMARDALAMPTCSKISSEQMAHIKSIIRGYSKKTFKPRHFEAEEQAPTSEEAAAAEEQAPTSEEAAAEGRISKKEEKNLSFWRRIFYGEKDEDDVDKDDDDDDDDEDTEEDNDEDTEEEDDDEDGYERGKDGKEDPNEEEDEHERKKRKSRK